MASKIITEELKTSIINYYTSRPMGLQELVNRYKLSIPTLGKILKGVNRWDKNLVYNPNLVEDYFENIDSEEKSYFLGLLISDGNVFCSKTGRSSSISITLQESDKYLLEKFKSELHTNTKIAADGRGCYQIAIRSNKLAKDLSKYGIVPCKTLKTYLPLNIPKNLMCHMFRGIMDGDGSLFIKPKDNKGHLYHTVSFCGTHQLMQEMSDYLFNNLSLTFHSNIYDYSNRNLSEFKINNLHDVSLYLDWVYRASSIHLIRKYDKYILFKNLTNNQPNI